MKHKGWEIFVVDGRYDYSRARAVPPAGHWYKEWRSPMFSTGSPADMENAAYRAAVAYIDALPVNNPAPDVDLETGVRLVQTSNSRRPMKAGQI